MSSIAHDSDTPIHELFSPEGVRLELPIAGPAPRIFAYWIDLCVIVGLFISMIAVLLATLPIGDAVDKLMHQVFHEAARQVSERNKGHNASFGALTGLLLALFVLSQFVVEFGYFIFWEMVTNGRSPGKILAGLRVVRRDGLPINLRSSVLRNVLRLVDMLPDSYVVGLVSMLLSPSGERLGDHVAGTIVIRLDRPGAAPEIDAPKNAGSLALTRAQIGRIGAPELQLIRATLRRVADPSSDRNNALLSEVADTMRTRLEFAEPLPSDPLSFLRELLALAERYSRNAD